MTAQNVQALKPGKPVDSMTAEEKQLMIAANIPLLQLVMNREENAFGAVWREVGFQ